MKFRLYKDSSSSSTGSIKKNKLAVLAIAIALLNICVQPIAKGEEESVTFMNAGDNLSLDNIQDIAFTLQRIRQQAINVYSEATRKKVYRFQLNLSSLPSVPTSPPEDQSAYLPLRKGWLVFFIGTMEPLVHILNKDLQHLDEKTAKSKMPDQYRADWQVIVNEWKSAIHELDSQLDACAALLNDSEAGNLQAAKAAQSIDMQVTALEKILHRASRFLRDKIPPA